MKTNYFDKLEFKNFEFSELKTYADYTFKNGISVRIVTGEYARATESRPYEMNVLYPNGYRERVSKLNRVMLELELQTLSKYIK